MINIGTASITCAELWGVFEGLSLAWELGFKNIILETDSKCVIQLLSKGIQQSNVHASLIASILNLLRQDWVVNIVHVHREGKFSTILRLWLRQCPLGHIT